MEPKTKNLRLKIIIGIIGWLFIVLSIFGVFAYNFYQELEELKGLRAQHKYEQDETLKEMVTSSNDMCPAMIDELTRMESVRLLPARYVVITSAVGVKKEELDMEQFTTSIEESITDAVCNSADFSAYRQLKATMVYVYHDREGVFLCTVKVKPAQYLKNETPPPPPPQQ